MDLHSKSIPGSCPFEMSPSPPILSRSLSHRVMSDLDKNTTHQAAQNEHCHLEIDTVKSLLEIVKELYPVFLSNFLLWVPEV